MTSQSPPCTILVIDPCPETQSRILGHVEGRGFSVVSASDPAAALSIIDLAAPDVVITDLFLPEAAGLSLTKTLRSRHEPCPVIIMAEGAPDASVVQALRAGAVDYLHKPVAEEELAHALQRARLQFSNNLAGIPGIRQSEIRVTMDSNPAHIRAVISWLLQSTAVTLPETQRLHLRGTLQELLFNAIEHGNLEIFYMEKQQALAEDRYEQLLEERLAHHRLKDRKVSIQVLFDKEGHSLTYRISDEGKGFKWRSVLHRSNDVCSSEDINGRGIFLARSFFPSLTYNDRGNEVTVTIPLN